jgi:hypothetical protein
MPIDETLYSSGQKNTLGIIEKLAVRLMAFILPWLRVLMSLPSPRVDCSDSIEEQARTARRQINEKSPPF